MQMTYVPPARQGPATTATTALGLLVALWAMLKGRLRTTFAATPALHHEDAVDGLDERMLRDIGAQDWSALREARHAREATQWRIDLGSS